MRAAALGGLTVLLTSSTASADRFEASGFIGLGVFTENTELGNSWAAEQVPNSAPVFGARVGWIALPQQPTARGFWDKLEVVVEGELSIATAFTGGFTGEVGRMSYFAPVFGWRGHGMLRFAQLRSFAPHLVLGAGGETVASSSPFMSKETDPVVYYGAGASFAINDQWRVRIDVRHGIMPGRDNGVSSTLEAQFGVQARFGLPTKRVHTTPPPVMTEVAKIPDDDVDSDGDGITDRLDLCPNEHETVNGVEDGDGCAEKDPDGDGIIATDKCPNQPEDFDGFEDEDGCPDPDNDGDGIPDARDTCPNQAETKNGVDDSDGCPDTVPDNIVKALAVGKTLRFEYNRARVTPLAARNLKPLHLMLLAHPDVAITITGVPEPTGNGDLAKRRAEAVKWYLVDQGITESRVDVAVSPAPAKPGAPVIELSLRTK